MTTRTRVLLAVLAVLASAQGPPPLDAYSVCQDFPQLEIMAGSNETITVSSTALGFTASKYAPTDAGPKAVYAYASVETDAIRYWEDGQTPTATAGHQVSANERFGVCGGAEIRRFLMIRKTTDATVRVSYYKRKGE